jgi:hypothetical protein
MIEKQKNSIKINRPVLTPQQVQSKEDLGSILNKHKKLTKRPVYKQRKFYLAVFLVLIVSLLMYYADKEERDLLPQQTEQTK